MDVQQIFALFIIVYLENFVRYVLGTSSFIPLEDSRLTTVSKFVKCTLKS